MREGSRKVLSTIPHVWELASKTEEHVKGFFTPGIFFEELGFNYIGPVDGHDLEALVRTLRNMRDLKGPQFLHIITNKGKGFEPAEADPIKYHALSPINASSKKVKTFSNIYSNGIVLRNTKNTKCIRRKSGSFLEAAIKGIFSY